MSEGIEELSLLSLVMMDITDGDAVHQAAQKVGSVIKTHHKGTPTDWLEAKPKNGDWNLCLVSLGRKKEELPFFAKCGLARLCRELRRQGHELSFLKV
jgi:uncharacterized protein (TIGR04141 family)